MSSQYLVRIGIWPMGTFADRPSSRNASRWITARAVWHRAIIVGVITMLRFLNIMLFFFIISALVDRIASVGHELFT